MSLPRKINVRGAIWTVRQEHCPKIEDIVVAGYCDRANHVICVEKDLNAKEKFETFMHEYLHAVFFESGVHDEGIPPWMEHQVINMIAKDMKNNISLWTKVFSAFDALHDSE